MILQPTKASRPRSLDLIPCQRSHVIGSHKVSIQQQISSSFPVRTNNFFNHGLFYHNYSMKYKFLPFVQASNPTRIQLVISYEACQYCLTDWSCSQQGSQLGKIVDGFLSSPLEACIAPSYISLGYRNFGMSCKENFSLMRINNMHARNQYFQISFF